MATESAWFEASEPKWAHRGEILPSCRRWVSEEPQESREGCRVKRGPPWAQQVLPGVNMLNSNWKRRNERWVRHGPHPPQSNSFQSWERSSQCLSSPVGVPGRHCLPCRGGSWWLWEPDSEEPVGSCSWVACAVCFILLSYFTTSPKGIKAIFNWDVPSWEVLWGQKKKAGSKGQNNDKWTQAEQRGERSGIWWLDQLVPVEPIADDSISWTVMRTWTKPGSVDLEKGPVDFENGGTILQNLQPLNTNGIWWVKEKKNNNEVSSLAQVKWKHYQPGWDIWDEWSRETSVQQWRGQFRPSCLEFLKYRLWTK